MNSLNCLFCMTNPKVLKLKWYKQKSSNSSQLRCWNYGMFGILLKRLSSVFFILDPITPCLCLCDWDNIFWNCFSIEWALVSSSETWRQRNPCGQLHTVKVRPLKFLFLPRTCSDSYDKCLTTLWKDPYRDRRFVKSVRPFWFNQKQSLYLSSQRHQTPLIKTGILTSLLFPAASIC